MTEAAPDAELSPNPLPPHVLAIESLDSSVAINVSPLGGQVWRGVIGGRDILLPLEDEHSIARDIRPTLKPNPFPVGETSAPGGTWLSFGGGTLKDESGTIISQAPVHGPFSAAWNKFRYQLDRARILLTGGTEGTAPFFRPGQKFGVSREVTATEGADGQNGAIMITNIITNLADEATDLPAAAEHAYFVSQPAELDESQGERTVRPTAAILNADGSLTYPEELEHVDPDNGNAIDAYLTPDHSGTPGKCVFLPDGIGGRVVVIDAVVVRANGQRVPVGRFDVYRHGDNDAWTALEPVMAGIRLEAGEAVSMTTTIQSFDSLDAYQRSRTVQEVN